MHVGFSEAELGSPPSSTPLDRLGLRSPSSFCLLLQANESGDELLEQGIKALVRKLADRETAVSLVKSHPPFDQRWALLFIEGGGAYCGTNQWLRGH